MKRFRLFVILLIVAKCCSSGFALQLASDSGKVDQTDPGFSPGPVRLADIATISGIDECERWAAGELTAALRTAKVDPDATGITVQIISTAGSPESFDLNVSGSNAAISAPDGNGAMYGLQEVMEQLANSKVTGKWTDVAAALKSTRQKPAVGLRADNAFIHTSKDGILFDVPMWEGYVDMLAHNRFNMLDLHGLYDIETTQFPNIYPLLITVPQYPTEGNVTIQKRNLEDFKTIIAYAKSHGVRVGFMNYAVKGDNVAPEQLADYTAKAVSNLLTALPDLKMLGFRIGETGQPETFFRDAYLKGVEDSGRSLPLYTRSWLSTRTKVETIGKAIESGFNVEIKYNGEQLGLPYQAMHGSEYSFSPSYSYENYLDLPAPFRIIWQVRANGTHRFWSWEDTDFIRRAAKTFSMGNALGFSLEPQMAYFPYAASEYYQKEEDKKVYQYIWQKHWMWYFAWGRLGYNPDLPVATLQAAYERRFGPQGASIYQAMQDSGWIVPLIMAYRDSGPDHRDYSPETESGLVAGRMDNHINKNETPLFRYGRGAAMDSRQFASIQNFVTAKIDGKVDGRIGPFEIASRLTKMAEKTRQDVAEVTGLSGQSADEWRLLKTDLLAASALADYHAARILGTTYLLYALQGDSEPDSQIAIKYLADSREDWSKLASITDSVYAPLPNPLRKQKEFKWANESAIIDTTDATVDTVLQTRNRRGSPLKPLEVTESDHNEDVAGTKLQDVIKNKRNVISLQLPPGHSATQVLLWYKELPSTNDWKSQPMETGKDGLFSVSLVQSSHGYLYEVEVQNGKEAYLYPDVFQETPYRVIPPY